jgi:hypothetical protein
LLVSFFFAEWRNNYRCFVLPESFFLRRTAKQLSLLCFTRILFPRRMAKHQPLLCFAPIFISSTDVETSTTTLFCPNLYFLDGCRNNYRCFALPESFLFAEWRNINCFFASLNLFLFAVQAKSSFSSRRRSRLSNIKLTCFAGFAVGKIGVKLA